jgi:hypothetical protein
VLFKTGMFGAALRGRLTPGWGVCIPCIEREAYTGVERLYTVH